MSIPQLEPVDESPVKYDVKRSGAKKRMSQAIGCLAKLTSSEATRQKYKEQREARQAAMIARAEQQAYEEEHEDAITTLEFKIQKHLEFGQELLVVGSVRQLGTWVPASGIPLSWNEGDYWTGAVTVQRSEVPRIEYKYIVKSISEDAALDINWETGGNHNILAKPARRMQLMDVWEFPGYKL